VLKYSASVIARVAIVFSNTATDGSASEAAAASEAASVAFVLGSSSRPCRRRPPSTSCSTGGIYKSAMSTSGVGGRAFRASGQDFSALLISYRRQSLV
jgi:hypothetical protein